MLPQCSKSRLVLKESALSLGIAGPNGIFTGAAADASAVAAHTLSQHAFDAASPAPMSAFMVFVFSMSPPGAFSPAAPPCAHKVQQLFRRLAPPTARPATGAIGHLPGPRRPACSSGRARIAARRAPAASMP